MNCLEYVKLDLTDYQQFAVQPKADTSEDDKISEFSGLNELILSRSGSQNVDYQNVKNLDTFLILKSLTSMRGVLLMLMNYKYTEIPIKKTAFR